MSDTGTYRGPYLSVLASPHLLDWPPDVLDWLERRVGPLGWPHVVAAKRAQR